MTVEAPTGGTVPRSEAGEPVRRAIERIDWSQTELGAAALWPPRVLGLVDAVLLSPLPCLLAWGEEAWVVCNDAFAALGAEARALLGRPLPNSAPDSAIVLAGLDRATMRRAAAGETLCLLDKALLGRSSPGLRRFDLHAAPVHAAPLAAGDGRWRGALCTLVERTGPGAGAATGLAVTNAPAAGLPAAGSPAPDGRLTARHQALLLALADEFRAAKAPDDIVMVAAAAIGRTLGASRVGYGEIDPAHEEAVFTLGWSDGSLPRPMGSVAIDRLAPGEGRRLREGRTVFTPPQPVAPAGAAPAGAAPAGAAPTGATTTGAAPAGATVLAGLVVPLVREGRLRDVFVIERRGRPNWRPAEVALAEEVATRAWDAADRVQAATILRRNQARQGFLLVLGDRLRELEDSDEIMETVAESLGRHLKLGRVGYGEIVTGAVSHRPGEEIVFGTGWSDGRVPPLVGRFPLGDLGPDHVADLTRGLTTAFDPQREAAIPPPVMSGLKALAAVPLIRDGRLRGALVLGHRDEHRWTAEEIALAGEVAARLWEALERARAEAALHDLNATLENRVIERTQALAASEARFRTLFENAPAPIYLIRVGPGAQASFDAVNAAALRFMGTSGLDVRGEAVSGATRDGEPMLDLCLRCAETGQPLQYELTVEDGGGTRTAECVLAPLPIEDDDTQILIGIARDITAQRNAEEQLRQAQKMEAIGQLTGGIAHDFNNLLTGIIGSLALMEKRLAQGRTDVIGRYVGLAMTSANRAAALTHRLLAFSRRQPLEARPVNVNTLVVAMDDLLRRTLGESVALETRVDEAIWLTLCDPHQLENALLNLAINARDAMPDGGRLTIATVNAAVDDAMAARDPGLPTGQYVEVAVTDTGTGMPADVIARAFDPFFTTKPIGQGTGLGLSMIYGFAKQSEGHVTINSEVGRGTTVHIFLPRFRGRDLGDAATAHGPAPRPGAGEAVLVVEDDPTVRGLVLEVLNELGYLAIEASDGPAGLRVLQSARRIDLLVTDVGLPGMNGRQLAEQGRLSRPDLKVLFITGYAENAAFGGGHLDAGMNMMTKPFAVDELAARLRTILEG